MNRRNPDAPTTEVEVRLAWPFGNVEHRTTARLEVMDNRSRRQVMTIDLDPEQFASLMAGRGAVVTAELLSPKHYEKVGKWWDVLVWNQADMEAEGLQDFIKYRDPERWNRRPAKSQPSQEMVDFAAREAYKLGYTEWTWLEHNWGWGIRFGRYVDEDPRA